MLRRPEIGRQICPMSSLSVGDHVITATYSRDGTFTGSSATLTETVLAS